MGQPRAARAHAGRSTHPLRLRGPQSRARQCPLSWPQRGGGARTSHAPRPLGAAPRGGRRGGLDLPGLAVGGARPGASLDWISAGARGGSSRKGGGGDGGRRAGRQVDFSKHAGRLTLLSEATRQHRLSRTAHSEPAGSGSTAAVKRRRMICGVAPPPPLPPQERVDQRSTGSAATTSLGGASRGSTYMRLYSLSPFL